MEEVSRRGRAATAEGVSPRPDMGGPGDGDSAPSAAERLRATEAELQRTRDWLAFMSDASDALSSSLDYRTTLGVAADLAVPRLADWCAIHIAEDGEEAAPLVIAHADAERARWGRAILGTLPLRPEHLRAFPAMSTGEPELHADIPEPLVLALGRTPDEKEALRAVCVRSVMVLPLAARGRVFGALTLIVGESGRRFTQQDVELNMHLARRCAQAIDTALLYQRAQQEIEERTRAKEALRRSEERFALAFRSSPTALFILRLQDKTLLDVNDRWERLFEMAREDVVGRTPADIGLAGAPADQQRQVATLEAEHRFRDRDMLVTTPNGARQLCVSVETTHIGGEPCLLGFVEDVTEQRRANVTLEAERRRLAVTLRSIADGVIATDTEGRVTLINPIAEVLTGWAASEAVGRPIGEVFHVFSRRTGLPAPVPVNRVLETGEMVGPHHHARLVARDGTERIVEDSAAPIRDHDGHVAGVVLVLRDVTRQERIEVELRRASKLDSLGVLAGGIAHDFNNLLTGILANLSIAALEAGDGSPLSSRLAKAERATLRARDLTQQLLTFAKGGDPIRRPTSLRELVVDAAMFALAGSTISTELHFGEGLWTAEVDAGQVAQVIQNLAINAQQAMPGGGKLTVRASNVVLHENDGLPLCPGRYVRIEVGDEGCGIPPEALPQIFDPFYTTKARGSGLGLATTYAIIQKHAGHIRVERTSAEGTVFSLHLPASEHQISVVEHEQRPWFGEGRVLAMDDEPIMRETLRETLRVLGFEPVVVRDGEEAVARYVQALREGEPFTAVILDLTIAGGMGGRETIGRLRAIDPAVRAIVSSGYSDDPVMARYRDHGFRGVVAKPYTLAELRAVLRAVVSR